MWDRNFTHIYKLILLLHEMDYAMPEKRKSRSDKRAKGRYNIYKKGGGRREGGRTREDVK